MDNFLNRICFHPEGEESAGGEANANVSDSGGGADADGSTGDWKDSITDSELRGSAQIAGYKSMDDLVKGHNNAQALIGRDRVVIPADDASDADKGAFFGKLGRPEEATGYKFEPVEGMDPALVPADTVTSYQNEAHRLGLSQRQAAGLHSWFMKDAQASSQGVNDSIESASKANDEALKSEWGQSYDEKMDLAKQAVNEFGGDDLKSAMDETGLGNDPRMIKAFAGIGRAMSDDKLYASGGEAGTGYKQSPSEANAEINQLLGDKEFLATYQDNQHPGHVGAVEKMMKLHEAANPS